MGNLAKVYDCKNLYKIKTSCNFERSYSPAVILNEVKNPLAFRFKVGILRFAQYDTAFLYIINNF